MGDSLMKKLIALLLFVTFAYPQSASYSPQTSITTANTMAVDAFGRWRASFPVTLFDAQNQYNSSPLFWQDSLGANSDTNFVFNGSAVQLTTTNAGAGNIIRQTRSYFRYQSGKSQFILLTGVPHVGKTNSTKRWGYYDAQDGIFFQLSGTTLSVVKRSSVSGSVIDSVINQSSFNMDKLDGTGSSGFNLRPYNAQVFFIDIAWLGVSRVRMGIVSRGQTIVCHEFQNANNNTGVYMRTANLPVRYELATSAGVADTLTAICTSVQSEAGDQNESGLGFSASNGTSQVGVTTRRAILSVAPSLKFNGKTNRMLFKNFEVELYTTTNSAFYEIVYDGTLGGSPSWTSVDASNSGMQYDVAGTTVTGGIVVASGFINASATVRGVATKELLDKLRLTLDIAGSQRKILSVVITSFTGTTNASASLSWTEIY